MVQDLEDDEWLSRPSHAPVFEALIEKQLVFDALVLPRHLSHTLTVVERHPELSVVIDHAAKPTLKDGVDKRYYEDMSALAKHASVSCKLSGLVTEARKDWTVGDLVPVVDHLLQEFGAERLLWGSDWPVVTLACDYATWWKTTQQLIGKLDPEQKDAILGGNAKRIYLTPREA
jgi:L-fuconolactonase